MSIKTIHEFDDLSGLIRQLGFLPLLDSPIAGFSAEEMAAEECRYHHYRDGSWSWPLWDWKGPAIQNTPCVYGKFFGGKAGFVSMEWWPDLMNYRQGKHPYPAENSVERAILDILQLNGAMITRELRSACGFTGGDCHPSADGMLHRYRRLCLSQRQARRTLRLRMGPAQHSGKHGGATRLSLRTHPGRVLPKDAATSSPATSASPRKGPPQTD